MFGPFGGQMASISCWSGRQFFVLALGVYGCIVAAQLGTPHWYLVATVLWMLGETMVDMTTETLVPELVPRSQFDLAGSTRALSFLLGALSGYAALIVFRNFHYSWLHYGYLIVMTDYWAPFGAWAANIRGMTHHVNLHFLLTPVLPGFVLLFILLSSLADWVRWPRGWHALKASRRQEQREWAKAAVAALTPFRFYTGILNATWTPYLLAMEGHQLMGERQSVFMGNAKLITIPAPSL